MSSTMLQGQPQLAQREFEVLRNFIENIAGISLSGTKKDLLQSRLRNRIGDLGLSGYRQYTELLKSLPQSHSEWQIFVNCITTNKTDFFRESQHFDFLIKNAIPDLLKKNPTQLKVWCCAASSGEEPYTISMCMNKALPEDTKFNVLSTDIDTEVLEIAKRGVYPKAAISQVPEQYRSDAFALGTGEIANWIKVRAHLREPVTFQKHNLIDSSLPLTAPFDIIFCRNVLIYFSRENTESVIRKLYRAAKRGAYLFVGHSESLQMIKHSWTNVAPSVYRKDGGQ